MHASAAVGKLTAPPPMRIPTKLDHVGSCPAMSRAFVEAVSACTSSRTCPGVAWYKRLLARIAQSQLPASTAISTEVRARTADEVITESGVNSMAFRNSPTRAASRRPRVVRERSWSLSHDAPQFDFPWRRTSRVNISSREGSAARRRFAQASGFTTWTWSKRPKSLSVVYRPAPCSIASAARWASITSCPRHWKSCSNSAKIRQ